MKTIRTHQLEIAGHPLTVRSSADPAYVARLAETIESHTQGALDQGAGIVAAGLLAALALADELERTREELASLRAERDAREATRRAEGDTREADLRAAVAERVTALRAAAK